MQGEDKGYNGSRILNEKRSEAGMHIKSDTFQRSFLRPGDRNR